MDKNIHDLAQDALNSMSPEVRKEAEAILKAAEENPIQAGAPEATYGKPYPADHKHGAFISIETGMEEVKNACRDCDHCGMDMDMDPYCAHPDVVKIHIHGLALHTGAVNKFCAFETRPLFEKRKPR